MHVNRLGPIQICLHHAMKPIHIANNIASHPGINVSTPPTALAGIYFKLAILMCFFCVHKWCKYWELNRKYSDTKLGPLHFFPNTHHLFSFSQNLFTSNFGLIRFDLFIPLPVLLLPFDSAVSLLPIIKMTKHN